MNERRLPFTIEEIEKLSKDFPTPFYVYDEQGIRNHLRELNRSFAWNPGFREYFPVKATPNPEILKILIEEGAGADCCSIPELVMAERVGLSGESIMLTSNNTGREEFLKAKQLRSLVNLDDPNHFDYLESLHCLPEVLCLRYNPGPVERDGRLILKHLIEEKFGMRKEQIFSTYSKALEKGIKRFGLHMMILSNDTNIDHFVSSIKIVFDLALEIYQRLHIRLEFVDIGGGIGIPYRPDQEKIEISFAANTVRQLYQDKLATYGLSPRIFIEAGRLITGQHGYLVTKVRHIKDSYKQFVGLDASMSDLMRPGMYGSYHHITVMGKETVTPSTPYDVVGSLCENNDKFAVDRVLPQLTQGDILVFHDVGAYGRGKTFNFNGKLRPAELLRGGDGKFKMIRRAETIDDYFATYI